MKQKMTNDIGERESVFLGHDTFSVLINKDKSMVPELCVKQDTGWVNAHWQPWFRRTTAEKWDSRKHEAFWHVSLLYDITGNFLCAPNFGPPHRLENLDLPAHGFTAEQEWSQRLLPAENSRTAVFSTLKPDRHPLEYAKWDLVKDQQNILYTRVDVKNSGGRQEKFNIGWHNTLGSPFLESGCLIDNNAAAFAVPGQGTEFDKTGRLKFGAVFESLEKVPLRNGGTADLRLVPGMIGYTDFITAAVPPGSKPAWAGVVNPRLKLVYFSWFEGSGDAETGPIPLNFYDLWMNYGGRPFTPWAAADGLQDRTFCLGTENATGYFANGLGESLDNPELLGRKTFLTINAGETRTLNYATTFTPYPDNILDGGIKSIEKSDKGLVITGKGGEFFTLPADTGFSILASL